MNILISGASGFIGKALVDALKKHNKITVLGRNETILGPRGVTEQRTDLSVF